MCLGVGRGSQLEAAGAVVPLLYCNATSEIEVCRRSESGKMFAGSCATAHRPQLSHPLIPPNAVGNNWQTGAPKLR
jgi:hypothetical protein